MIKLIRNSVYALLIATAAWAAEPDREIVRRQEPDYPELAMKSNIHGTVKVKIWIAPDGSVRRLEYVGGHPVLAEAALKAVKAWKYKPGPQETTSVVELKF